MENKIGKYYFVFLFNYINTLDILKNSNNITYPYEEFDDLDELMNYSDYMREYKGSILGLQIKLDNKEIVGNYKLNDISMDVKLNDEERVYIVYGFFIKFETN